jgi:HD superfamily phosphohydrolase
VGDALREEGFDPQTLSRLAIGLLEKPPQPFYNQVIRSSVDVDKLDFVVRDSYHTGAGYGFVDVFRLIYTMDVLDGNLAVDATALPTLESLIIARLESFRAVYFHRVSRAAQMMLLRALEFAKDDLGIPQLKKIEDYLALDDYVVWGKLLEHKQARKIIQDVANRKLLKTAYEKTFFVRDEMVANVFNKESFRDKIAEEIATKAKVGKDEVVLDVPSLPSVPYHYAMQIAPMDIPIFSKTRTGQKVPQKIGELSDLVNLLTNYMNIVRVYTKAEFRDRVAAAAVDVLGESPLSNIVSY